MAENNSSAPLKTAEGAALALPYPELWRDSAGIRGYTADPGQGPWFTADQMLAYAAKAVAAQAPAAVAPVLDSDWRFRMLDGTAIERDDMGCGEHPALPTLEEGMKPKQFFDALGVELQCVMAEDQMNMDAYEAMVEAPNYNAWTPSAPEGQGWKQVAIFDTEDGPACWWIREAQPSPRMRHTRTTPAAVHTKLSADAGRLAYVADQIRALEPVGSEGDVFLTEVIQVLKDCAEAMATRALPATEGSSAGDLAAASHQTKLLAQALGDCILASGIVRSDLEMSGPQLLMFAEDLKEQLLARQAEVQAEPVAWTPGPNEFKDWCSQWFGPDADDSYLAKAVFALPKMAQKFANTAPQAQPADALEPIRQAVRDYHYALDTRQHGGSAANAAVDAIQDVLGMHWMRDQEKDRRAAMAAAQEGGKA